MIFIHSFSEDVNEDFWSLKKHKNLHFSKSKKHKIQGTYTKQRNGGTKNKHCNLLIYTVSRNRVLIERCYYNIQTINCRNNAELIFLQHIYQEMSSKTLGTSKNTKIYISQNQKNTKYRVHTKTTERGNQKQTLQSVDLHSPTEQSTDWTLLLQYSNNKLS